MAPTWLLDIFATLMLVVAAVSATRLAAARLPANRLSPVEPIGHRSWLRGSGGADTDIAHLLMDIAMAGMLVAGLKTLPSGAWEAVFGVLTVWFTWRLARDTRANGARSLAGGYRAVHSAAMVYMFAALRTSDGMDALEYPTLALAFALVFVCSSLWDLYQLFGRRHLLGSQHRPAPPESAPSEPATSRRRPELLSSPPLRHPTPRSSAQHPAPVVSDAMLAARAHLLSPVTTVACRIVISVTMVFLLLTMI